MSPIRPKYYSEARINGGDRLIHRIDGGRLWVVDVVTHCRTPHLLDGQHIE